MTIRVSDVVLRLSNLKGVSISTCTGKDRKFVQLEPDGVIKQLSCSGSPSTGILPDVENQLKNIIRSTRSGIPLKPEQLRLLNLEVLHLRERMLIEQVRQELQNAFKSARRLCKFAKILIQNSVPHGVTYVTARTGEIEAQAQVVLTQAVKASQKQQYRNVIKIIGDQVSRCLTLAAELESPNLRATALRLKELKQKCKKGSAKAPALAPHSGLTFLLGRGITQNLLRWIDLNPCSIEVTAELRELQEHKTIMRPDELLQLCRSDRIKAIPTRTYPNPSVDPEATDFFLNRMFSQTKIADKHLVGTQFGEPAGKAMETDFKWLWERQQVIYRHFQSNFSKDNVVNSLSVFAFSDSERAETLYSAIRFRTKKAVRWSRCAEYMIDFCGQGSAIFLQAAMVARGLASSGMWKLIVDRNLVTLHSIAQDQKIDPIIRDKAAENRVKVLQQRLLSQPDWRHDNTFQ